MRLTRAVSLALVLLAALAGPVGAAYECFEIPNVAVAAFPTQQSPLWQQDTQIIGLAARGNGIVNSPGACKVVPQASPDMTTRITTGCTVVVDGATASVATGNFTHSAAHATMSRIDIVSASSAGVKTVTTGTAATPKPAPPTIPDGHVVLAFVTVPGADTAIAANQIVDKRMCVNTPGVGTGAATTLSYITKVAEGTLSNEFAMGSLATGLVQNTVTTGIPTTIAPTDDNTVVGNGTTWQIKALPTCSGATSALTYNISTNAFGCNTIAGGGDVVGPASATDGQIALFNGTSGTLIKAAVSTGVVRVTSGVSVVAEFTGDVTSTAHALTIANSAVTPAKMANASTGTVLIGGSPPSFSGFPVVSRMTSNTQFGVGLDPYGAAAGNTGALFFRELAANGTHIAMLKAPDAMAADYTYVLPDALPGSTQALTVTSGGVMGYQTIAGGGDFSSNTSSSVDGEFVLFSGTGGKTGKRAAATGVVRMTSGVSVVAEFTGDVTSTAHALTIPNDTVTYAKMQNVSAASRVLCRGSAGGAGNPEECTIGSGLAMTGTTLSATGGGSSSDVVAVVTSDVTVTNSSTLADITGLVLPISSSATEIWQIEVQLLTTGTGASTAYDIKFGWTFPAAVTMNWAPHVSNTTPYFNPPANTGSVTALLTQTSQPTYGATTGIVGGIFFRGWVFGGGTAGNVQFRFAESTAVAATSVIIKKGSVLFARKLVN